MRKFLALIAGVATTFSFAAFGPVQSSPFAGTWVNIDPGTHGIVSLNIVVSGDKLTVAGKGKCNPQNCDLPAVDATVYRDRSFGVLGHTWVAGNERSKITMQATSRILSLADGDYLELEVLTSYREAKPRTPSRERYILRRQTK